MCFGIFVELFTRRGFVPEVFFFFAGPFNPACHAYTDDPAFSRLSKVSYCLIKYSFVSWLPEALLEMFTVGTVSKTYHFSLRSRAEFLSCDEGHLVGLSLGNTFNAANLCCNHRLFGRTSAITSSCSLFIFTLIFLLDQRKMSYGCIWQ